MLNINVAKPRTKSHSNSQNCGNNPYISRSFSYDETSYIASAHKELQHLLGNPNKDKYWLAGTLSIDAELSETEHATAWKQFRENLKGAIVLYGVREFKQKKVKGKWKNLLHYHLLILRPDDAPLSLIEKEPVDNPEFNRQRNKIHRIIRNALPQSIKSHSRVWLSDHELLEGEKVAWCGYILKAKVKDETTDDKWKSERKLFPAHKKVIDGKRRGLKKIVFAGKFFSEAKQKIWDDYKQGLSLIEKEPVKVVEKQHQKRYQKRLEATLINQATIEQHHQSQHLHKLTAVPIDTILLNLIWSGLDADEFEGIQNQFRPIQYPDDCDLPTHINEALQNLDDWEEIITDECFGDAVESV